MIISSNDLDMLLEAQSIPRVGCAYHVNGTENNRVDYLPEATEDHRAIGSKIADNFDKAVMGVNGNTITAIVDKQDTHVIFSVWFNPVGPFGKLGALQFSKTVEITNGVASYVLDATPGLYRVRAYGTISHMSGFVEVTVT